MSAQRLGISDSALLLVDFQRGVLERPPGSGVPPAAYAALLKAGEIASAYRASSLPVILIGVERRSDYQDVAEHATDALDARPSSTVPDVRRLVSDTDDVFFAPELARAKEDYVVMKRRVSAFYATPLEIYLRALNVRTFVIGGVFTDQGVETTVRDGFDRDFDIVALSDACWSPSERGHEHAISQTFPRLGRVRTVAEVIEDGDLGSKRSVGS